MLVVENHVPVLPTERRVFADTLEGLDLAAVWAAGELVPDVVRWS